MPRSEWWISPGGGRYRTIAMVSAFNAISVCSVSRIDQPTILRVCRSNGRTGHLIDERHLVERQVIGMDVHVPEPGHQIPAFKIDRLRVAGAARLCAWQDGADAAILDQHGAIRP